MAGSYICVYMTQYNAYIVNRVPALWLTMLLSAVGIAGLYLFFIRVLYNGYDDLDMLIFVLACVPVILLSRLIGRVAAANRVYVTLDSEEITIKWLPGIWVRNRPDTVFHSSDIKSYSCQFTGNIYDTIDLVPVYGWGLTLRRRLVPFRAVKGFDRLVAGIIKVLKPQGVQVESNFFQSLIADVDYKAAAGKDEPVMHCKARKVYTGYIWMVCLGVLGAYLALMVATIVAGGEDSPNAIWGLVFAGVIVVPILLFLLIKPCIVKLAVILHTDRVVITSSKTLFFGSKELVYYYSDINELMVWDAGNNYSRIIISSHGKQLKFSEIRHKRNDPADIGYHAADYLAGVYQHYINTYSTAGHVKWKRSDYGWVGGVDLGDLLVVLVELGAHGV